MSARLLPEPFAHLDPLVAQWSLATEALRFRKRVGSSLEQLEAFHRQVFPHVDAMIEHLNRIPTDDPARLTAPDRRLFDMVLMLMEACSALDLEWDGTDIEDTWPADRMTFLPPSDLPVSGPR